jgi:hypothetical protein
MEIIQQFEITIVYYDPKLYDQENNTAFEKTLTFQGWYKTAEQAMQHAAYEVNRTENFGMEIISCSVVFETAVKE